MRICILLLAVVLSGCRSPLEAGWRLADSGDEPAAVRAFSRALADADAGYRRVAARELLARGEESLPYLVESLQKGGAYHDLFYAGERADAAWALGKLGGSKAVGPLLDAVERCRMQRREERVSHAIRALGSWNGMRLLISELGVAGASKAERARAKEEVVAALSKLEDTAAAALSDKDGYYSEQELSACIDALRAVPGDDRTLAVVRTRAADALEKGLLRDMRRYAPAGMREEVEALGRLGDGRAVPVLVSLLSETVVRDEAALALLHIGSPEGIAALRGVAAAAPDDWWPLLPALDVPVGAAEGRVGGRQLRLLLGVGAAPPRDVLAAASPYLRAEALRALAAADDPPEWAVPEAALLLNDLVEDVAAAACETLAALGADDRVPDLKGLFGSSGWVAAAAALAVVELGGPDPEALEVARDVAFGDSSWGRLQAAAALPEGCRALGVPADSPLAESVCIKAIERFIASRPAMERGALVLLLRDPDKVYYGKDTKRPFDRALPVDVLRSRAAVVDDPVLQALLLALADLRDVAPVPARVAALRAIVEAGPSENDLSAARSVAADSREVALVRWWARVLCGASEAVEVGT